MNFQTNNPQEIHKVFDNTEFQTLPNSVNGTIALIPYLSAKGEDGKLKLWDNLGEFILKNGAPNFRKHGQAIYNAIAHLNAGGKFYGYRLAAPDAKYSNILVKVGIKVENISSPVSLKSTPEDKTKDGKEAKLSLAAKSVSPSPTKRIVSKIITERLDNLNSKDAQEAAVTAPSSVVDGFTVYPLFLVTSKGRSSAANGSMLRMTRNTSATADNGRPVYDMELMYDNNGQGVYETGGKFISYLDPEFKINGLSYYLESMSNKYLEMHDIRVNEDSYYAIETQIAEVAYEHNVNVYEIDYLIQQQTELPYITFDPTSVNLQQTVILSGGTDGSWTGPLDYTNMAGLSTALAAFYSGETEPAILDKNQVPASILFDANYPNEVKNAMGGLVLSEEVRDDMIAYLDLGFANTTTALVEAKANLTFDNNSICINGWNFKTYDPYTQRDIPVTSSWSFAAKLANHDRNFGINRPMAGYDTGILTGVVDGSLRPLPAKNEEKGKLYDNQINYVEKIKGVYMIGSQSTTQVKKSDLQLINNTRLKGEIIRKIMALVPQFKFNFTDPETLNTFKSLATLQLEDVGKLLKEPIKIVFSQTQYQRDNRILQVELNLIFKSTIEKVYVPININKNLG